MTTLFFVGKCQVNTITTHFFRLLGGDISVGFCVVFLWFLCRFSYWRILTPLYY